MTNRGGRSGASNVVRLAPKASRDLKDVAVIDVGSNSVRLVIYRLDGRDFTPVLNDRAAAGLGRDLSDTGKLSPEGAQAALAAARRFRMFLSARQVREIRAVGTAAVREAADAGPFLREMERAIGAKVRVLSGEEEGRYAALGVLAGDPGANGVVADLGGSSLELAPVAGSEVGAPVTLPLGALTLAARTKGDMKAARALIDASLDKSGMKAESGRALYAVGGAWRNFAKIAMAQRQYPLKFLQGFTQDAAAVSDLARFLAKQSPASISKMSTISRRRAEAMPYAAAVLDRLIRRLNVREVVTSAFGLREGVLLEALPSDVRRADPLLAGVDAMARRAGAQISFGAAVEKWIAPLAGALGSAFGPERDATLFVAACRLADIGGALHPDHRDELASDRVLFAQFAGASHVERVFLARVVHHRYAGRRDPDGAMAELERLMSPEARDTALRLGLALRLAGAISGRAASLLKESRLAIAGDELLLHLSANGADLATEVVDKRLQQLADAAGRTPRIVIA